MLAKPKTKKVAVLLAFISAVSPISGFHKFYLRQPGWGILYLILSWTLVPKIASITEAIWYLIQDQSDFDTNFNAGLGLQSASTTVTPTVAAVDPVQVSAIADALRQLDQLRLDGLISEYEFEQKRRQLLDRIG